VRPASAREVDQLGRGPAMPSSTKCSRSSRAPTRSRAA